MLREFWFARDHALRLLGGGGDGAGAGATLPRPQRAQGGRARMRMLLLLLLLPVVSGSGGGGGAGHPAGQLHGQLLHVGPAQPLLIASAHQVHGDVLLPAPGRGAVALRAADRVARAAGHPPGLRRQHVHLHLGGRGPRG